MSLLLDRIEGGPYRFGRGGQITVADREHGVEQTFTDEVLIARSNRILNTMTVSDGTLPSSGARERAIADCHRVQDAIATRYQDLVREGLLHTMLTVRDRDLSTPAEAVGSTLDPVQQEAH